MAVISFKKKLHAEMKRCHFITNLLCCTEKMSSDQGPDPTLIYACETPVNPTGVMHTCGQDFAHDH